MLNKLTAAYNQCISLPILIFSTCIILSITIKLEEHSNLSLAILGDLILTAPIVYTLSNRKKRISKYAVLRVVTVGLLLATIILNNQQLNILKYIKMWVSPVLESIIIITIARRFYLIKKGSSLDPIGSADFLSNCRIALTTLFGSEPVANIISAEVATFYYLFKRKSQFDNIKSFSVYKDSGISIVLLSVTGLFLVETAGMHLLLSIWNKSVAWVLTTLGLYTCVQMIAHIKALQCRPTELTNKYVVIRSGLIGGDVLIQYADILSVEFYQNAKYDNSVKIGLLKNFEKPTIAIHTKSPITVIKAFGIKKITETVLIPMDSPKEFLSKLSRRLDEQISLNCSN